MNTFCSCSNPEIETKEDGISIVVSCGRCGESVVTTNIDKLQESNPWLGDETEYEVYLDNNEIEKKVYVEILKRYNAISTSKALELYNNNKRVLIFSGKGQEFYRICQYLNKVNANYETKPDCSYIRST